MRATRPEQFQATVQQEGAFKFIAIPFSPRQVWGARPRYYVAGTVNQIPVRGTLGAQGQAFFLRLSTAWLKDHGVEVGAHVFVSLSLEERR